MYLKVMQLLQFVQIKDFYAKSNRINSLIGKYWEFEFLVNPAKELTELFCKKNEIFKSGQMYLKVVKLVQLVQIENYYAETNRIISLIDMY